MSRRRRAEKRRINPDPKYNDGLIAKFINILMHNGKKSVARKILYNAMDSVAGRDLVIVYDGRSGTAVAFDRRVDGRLLTFELVSPLDGLQLRDQETGSIWSGLSGTAEEGPLAGTTLRQVPSFYSFWFAWSDFYVNTDLYQAIGS